MASVGSKSSGRGRGGGRRSFSRNRGGRGAQSRNSTEQAQNQDTRDRPARPTHFLSLPLGQYPSLRSKIETFKDALLNSSLNAISGLDPTIVINPRRLHLTLGVMALHPENSASESPSEKTVRTTLELLNSLRPQLLQEGPLQIPLKHLGAFESKKGARVLWVSPKEGVQQGESSEDKVQREKLMRVCNLVHQTFKQAGYITDTRPLKLHCTILNTTWRKPSSKRHLLFSFDDVLRSTALADIRVIPQSSIESMSQTIISLESESSMQGGAQARTSVERSTDPEQENLQEDTVVLGGRGSVVSTQTERLVDVDLGTYTVSEIQLCVMGSHGPEDEYVSVGSISLTDM